MLTPFKSAPEVQARTAQFGRTVSLLLRRSHLYVALFLTPWMLMYALSTIVFNHYERFAGFYGGEMDRFVHEREIVYTRAFAAGTAPRKIAEQILEDLNLSGGMSVDSRAQDRLVISRLDPTAGRRITYLPADKKLLIERQVFRTPGFLTNLHSRVGYGSRHKGPNAWAVSVDLSIAATLLWAISGFWMWWEMKATRRPGIFITSLGLAALAAFLLVG